MPRLTRVEDYIEDTYAWEDTAGSDVTIDTLLNDATYISSQAGITLNEIPGIPDIRYTDLIDIGEDTFQGALYPTGQEEVVASRHNPPKEKVFPFDNDSQHTKKL